jgi:hypothetical protein
MTNPDTLKQILKEAKQEIENWPRWMKNQEPTLSRNQDAVVQELRGKEKEDRGDNGAGPEKLSA